MKPSLLVLVVLLGLAVTAHAQAPSTMSYQGVLTDVSGNIVPDGPYDLTFRIYDVAVGGAALWTEAQAGVPVVRGGFGVTLGLGTPISLLFDRTYYLGVQVFADPELTPRVRLASSPYALSLRLPFAQAVSSATSLFYVQNLGAGQAMVADGILDVGTTTHDGRLRVFRNGSAARVTDLQSSVNGGLVDVYDETGGTAALVEADANGSGGFLGAYRTTGLVGFTVDGNFGGTNEPKVSVSGSARSAVFDMSATGNPSVVLPTDAIAAAEVLDEPGIASNTESAALGMDGTIQTLLSRSISCPAGGYVVAMGTAQASVSNTNGVGSIAIFGVSDVAGAFPANQDMGWVIPSSAPTGAYTQVVTVQGVFTVTAGLHTFYFLGDESTGNWTVNDRGLSLMYFPTAYGTVDPPVPQRSARGDDDVHARMGRALDSTDIATEQAEARRFNDARLRRELDEMRARLDQLQRELAETAAAQARAAAGPGR